MQTIYRAAVCSNRKWTYAGHSSDTIVVSESQTYNSLTAFLDCDLWVSSTLCGQELNSDLYGISVRTSVTVLTFHMIQIIISSQNCSSALHRCISQFLVLRTMSVGLGVGKLSEDGDRMNVSMTVLCELIDPTSRIEIQFHSCEIYRLSNRLINLASYFKAVKVLTSGIVQRVLTLVAK